MRFAIVLVILRKELLETLRDRRTLVRLFLVPLILYPLFAIAVSKLQGSEMEAREARSSRIAVWGTMPDELAHALESDPKLAFEPWTGAPPEIRHDLEAGEIAPAPVPDAPPSSPSSKEKGKDKQKPKPPSTDPEDRIFHAARDAVSSRKTEAVLVITQSFGASLDSGAKGPVTIYYDSVRDDSAVAHDRLDDALRAARKTLLRTREERRGLPRGFTQAIDVLARNVAPDSRRVGQILGSMMPMMLILMSLLGSFLPAIDLTAGEKERGTMQTLLCAPLRPIEIIWGKFLAVFVIALITALANVVSLALTIKRILPGEMDVAPSVYLLTFSLLLPVTFLFAAVFLALAVFAKDFKDAQNVLMPVYLPITLLAGLTGLPGVELNAWTAFAPVMNIALLIKALFLGEAPPNLVFLALGSSALYAALALLLAARVFERETVLLGGRESARTLLGLERRDGGEPTAGFALAAFGVIQVVFFYGSLLIEHASVPVQLAGAQYGMFLIPTLACVFLFGFSPRSTLALRAPPARGVVAAAIVGGTAWAVSIGILFRIVPPPESLTRELEKLVIFEGKPFWLIFLLVAATPAICEELLFRGLLYSGLRRLGVLPALMISALLFGLAHGSVYRLLPTAFLGLALGYAREKTGSIAPGMLIHALNNGLAVALLYYKPAWAAGVIEQGTLPWTVTLGGTLLFAGGIALLRGMHGAPERSPERHAPAP